MVAEDAADIHVRNNLRAGYKDILSLSPSHEDPMVVVVIFVEVFLVVAELPVLLREGENPT